MTAISPSNAHLSTDKSISHPRFSSFYNWLTDRPSIRREQAPWRREVVGKAHGVVLEVGAGGGQSFPYYDARSVTRVEATEPDETMLATAQTRLGSAPVPIELTPASVEALPFPDESFDSVVASIVFCSVEDPHRGLREILRVLRRGGDLLMLEHVRSTDSRMARLQGGLVPITTRLGGNCHWNRDTPNAVVAAGFEIVELRRVRAGLQPVVVLHARRGQSSSPCCGAHPLRDHIERER